MKTETDRTGWIKSKNNKEKNNKVGMKGSPFQLLKMYAFSIPDSKKDEQRRKFPLESGSICVIFLFKGSYNAISIQQNLSYIYTWYGLR